MSYRRLFVALVLGLWTWTSSVPAFAATRAQPSSTPSSAAAVEPPPDSPVQDPTLDPDLEQTPAMDVHPCPVGQTCSSPVAKASDVPPVPVLAVPPPPMAVPTQVHPRRALMITGWSVLATSYLLSLAVGATIYDSAHFESLSEIDDDDAAELEYHIHRRDRRAYGRRMSVPVVGPWIALGKANSAAAALGTAMLGAAQLTGLTLGIIGTHNYVHDRRVQRLAVSVVPLDGGAQSTVSWRF